MSQEKSPGSEAFSSIAEILPLHRRERGEKIALRFPPDGEMTYAALE